MLLVVLLLYVVLASAFNLATPYRTPGILLLQRGADGGPLPVADVGAPDERQHANYIQYLRENRSLPVFKPGAADLYETYQSHQPPLYYITGAIWSAMTGAVPVDPEAGFRLRFLNTIFGALTLIGIYCCATWSGEGRKMWGVLGAAIAGLMPMFMALHAAVSNDPMLICLCTWAFAYMIRLDRTELGWKHWIMLGTLLGAAMITKTTALGLIPLVGGLVWVNRSRPGILLHAGSAVLLSILIAMPVWIRNQSLYGDLFALKAFREAFTGNPTREQMIQMVQMMREAKGLSPAGAPQDYWLNWFGWWTLRSFFGAFGQMDIFYGPNIYRGLGALVGLTGVAGYLRKRSVGKGDVETDGHYSTLAWLFVAIILLLFLQFNLTYFQAQARYLYPAVAPISLGIAAGILALAGRYRATAVWVVICSMASCGWLTQDFLKGQFAIRLLPQGHQSQEKQ
ncbi:MAG: glycosyltransferase family 39 protein [Armatimonadetes bacterium]|nr:glycosyltransferase family 39 protein [Armatimonadota bacterium]